MRNLKIIKFLFLVICAHLSNPASIDNECERTNLELDLKNNQLRKTNAELRIEFDKLKLKLIEMGEKEKQLTGANELIYLNCSGLATHIEDVSESLKTLQEDIQSVKPLIVEHVKKYENKFKKNRAEEETYSVHYPKVCSALPHDNEKLFQVACDAMSSNGEWTVIQRRMDGKTNFYRPWVEYRAGFGNVTGEFFVGLQNLHIITTSRAYELQIAMEDFENGKRQANYDLFEIETEAEKYALNKLGTFSGDAGDSLDYNKSSKFSTYDEDNDAFSYNCAKSYNGAWWYNQCHYSNLNGEYGNKNIGKGVVWQHFRGSEYSLKFVEMKIRPKAL